MCKQLRDYLNEKRRYWKLKAEALDRALLRRLRTCRKTLGEDEEVCYGTSASYLFPVTDLVTSCIEFVSKS